MKFVHLRLKNFMRYIGENMIEFSREPEKNVTVVLGDNTVGKTTLAQAFRWVLYGELITTQYDDSKKVCILNNEVLGEMGTNDYRDVEVELKLENEGSSGVLYTYKIIRKAGFVRKYPQLVAVQKEGSLKLYVTDSTTGVTTPYDNQDKVNEIISELLPKSLSSYFLFDGERWNDDKKTKTDIKDSIYTLVGISPVRAMKEHLGDGRNNVIKYLKSKITGSGDEYIHLTNEIKRLESNIENEEKNLFDAQANADNFQKRVDEIESVLRANPNVEQEQKECERLEKEIKANENYMKTFYLDVVSLFSSAHSYFAAPLVDQILDILNEAGDLDSSDVPGVIDKTIYYILENKECICGHKIVPNSYEEQTLRNLLKVVPPAKIGTEIGQLKDTLVRWNSEGENLKLNIEEKAKLYQSEGDKKDENEEELERKQKKIDRKINFASERTKMEGYKKSVRQEQEKARRASMNINDYKQKISDLEKERDTLAEKDAKNARLKLYIAYAERLYKSASDIYYSKENTLVESLNEIIERNFSDMFNEKEKVARLGDDYVLRLFYKKVSTNDGYDNMEASGLSEGEKIARNFAFIVSILEFANKMKEEGDEVAQSLPLVLDGPFSKLSSINTAKVAKVLPAVSEQIIIFMLDKDWQPSGLEKYADSKYIYRTTKDIDGNSSKIQLDSEVK